MLCTAEKHLLWSELKLSVAILTWSWSISLDSALFQASLKGHSLSEENKIALFPHDCIETILALLNANDIGNFRGRNRLTDWLIETSLIGWQTDREEDRQTDRQTDKQVERHTTDKQAGCQTDRHTNQLAEWQTKIKANRQAQINRQRDRNTDRQAQISR